MLPAVVVDGYGTIGPSAFSGIDVGGAAVLLLTGWPCTGAPTDTATQPIRTEYGVLVGIDSVNIDDTRLFPGLVEVEVAVPRPVPALR